MDYHALSHASAFFPALCLLYHTVAPPSLFSKHPPIVYQKRYARIQLGNTRLDTRKAEHTYARTQDMRPQAATTDSWPAEGLEGTTRRDNPDRTPILGEQGQLSSALGQDSHRRGQSPFQDAASAGLITVHPQSPPR